ncbi:MAG TPA: serine hydrolase [Pyrinomonadaceae bacterium]|nr:serine hydrolase [Pyrinomonadaceae bacterium]
MKRVFLLAAASLCALLSPSPVSACSCLIGDPPAEFQRAKAVFVGRVLGGTEKLKAKGPDGRSQSLVAGEVRLAVEELFKGDPARETTLAVNSMLGTSCGDYGLRVGARYVVYAYASERGERLLYTGVCTRTVAADSSHAASDLTFLRSLPAIGARGNPRGGAGAVTAGAAAAELQRLLAAEVAANPSLPGQLLHVHAPRLNLDVSLAAGLFDRASKRPLEPRHGFRVASVTKTFVAASVLRLYEMGRLKLDDSINRHLPAEYISVLEAGGYPTRRITVRQLLTHTSGIHDYATDAQYFAVAERDPRHRWTRMEQVRAAVRWGKPRFAPGAGYHYSDTGYVLLGEIIERLTRRPLGEAYRTLLDFRRLGLDETYLETLESVPAGAAALSHPYFGDIDGTLIDPSFDLYGGGGLVSSAEDLARFYRALLRGRVFRRPSTLRTMLSVPPTNERSPGGAYAMGISRRLIAGHTCWGHTGFWGTSAYHCPAPDVTIVRHYNQARPDGGFVFNRLYEQIADALGLRG